MDRKMEEEAQRISRREFGIKTIKCSLGAGVALAGLSSSLYNLPRVYASNTDDAIEVPPKLLEKKIDGKYSAPVNELQRTDLGKGAEGRGWVYGNEWCDARYTPLLPASEYPEKIEGAIKTLHYKYPDGSRSLDLCCDYLSDPEISYPPIYERNDVLDILLDTNCDRASIPQPDDWWLIIELNERGRVRLFELQGTGRTTSLFGWDPPKDITESSSISVASSLITVLGKERVFYELSIYGEKYLGNSSKIGFAVQVQDGKTRRRMAFPQYWLYQYPGTWGYMEFMPQDIEHAVNDSYMILEFPDALVGLATAMGIPVGYKIFKRITGKKMDRRAFVRTVGTMGATAVVKIL